MFHKSRRREKKEKCDDDDEKNLLVLSEFFRCAQTHTADDLSNYFFGRLGGGSRITVKLKSCSNIFLKKNFTFLAWSFGPVCQVGANFDKRTPRWESFRIR